jgi:uncharacterized protein YjbI with pentapeptide repeats
LDYSQFTSLKIKNTKFINSTLKEVDFSNCDLQSSLFDNCDLNRAVFESSNLEKADFRTANNFTINPENNRMKKAKFSILGANNLLYKYDLTITN